jgi:hypothetical protein
MLANFQVDLFLCFGEWRGKFKFWILELDGLELILGLDFLRAFVPNINWGTSTMRIRDKKGGTHRIPPSRDPANQQLDEHFANLNVMTAREANRILRKGNTEAFLYVVRERDGFPPIEAAEDEPVVPQHRDPEVRAILDELRVVFSKSRAAAMPPERGARHRIDTGDNKPINQNAYPLSVEKMNELSEQVKELLKNGLIRPSASAWGFPVVFARKGDGKWRMCVDYRGLNRITSKNGYPLPRVQDLLDRIGRAQWLTKIDLASGFWQIRMDEDSVQKTAFNTTWGKFEWLVMPFGLCNAPATFQTVMNGVLREHLGEFVVVYLDDILIFSNTYEEHLDHLRTVLKSLKDNTLYAKTEKCTIAT